MLPGNTRKIDKSSILQKSIDYLHKHKEIAAQSESSEIKQDWKPPFLSNEEFTQLMLEALDGFFIVMLTDGNIIYISESITPLLEHLPSDLVDQNLLNFLPVAEHAEVYKALSSHPDVETLCSDYLKAKNQMEFCCHVLRGSLDPKKPPVYEYVKFMGNFKSLANMPLTTRNGLEGILQRSLQPAFDDQVCFIATVRLAKPQFIKDMCMVEEPNEEFTSRHSLEWKFLLLDHRAPPIIGYMPFEVLGTSGYDYYHVDDLHSLAKCHEHLMQFGKGKSCYYRFLTKGQQWIWLQTNYYITYHQWNSRPEFIVCTHTVVSYAEVRAERRREMGIEDSTPELTGDKMSLNTGSESQLNTSSLKEALERFSNSRTPSTSSRSSRKSSHTAVSDNTCTSTPSKLQMDISTPPRPPTVDMTPQRRSSVSTQSMSSQNTTQTGSSVQISQQQPQPQQQVQPNALFSAQLNAMQHLKDQLEQRTRMIEANIQKQQDELRQIHEQLQRVHGQGAPMIVQQPGGGFSVQLPQVGGAQTSIVGVGTQPGVVAIQGQNVTSTAHCGTVTQQQTLPQQQQQASRPLQPNLQSSSVTQCGPVYNTMMISQPANANVVQIPSGLAPKINQGNAINRFPAGQQLVTKIMTAPMACGAVMVPTSMFMGQVVTAYNPFAQQQGQTIALQTQSTDSQAQATALQSSHQQGAIQQQNKQQQQFVQSTRLLHGNQSTQLILQAFPIQQQSTFATSQPQQHQLKPQTQIQQKPATSHQTESRSAQSQ